MSADSQGAQSKLCVEPGAAAHTFDTSSEPYAFLSESLSLTSTLSDASGIRGTRSHDKTRVRDTQDVVSGSVVIHPSPLDLDKWLPRILGANESTDTFALAETLQAFGVLISRVADTHEYTDCWVNKATFRSAAGGFLELELEILGTTEATGTSYPSLTLGVTDADLPYVHSDLVLTLAGVARACKSIEISIDNHLETRFTNSLTATSITPQDRTIACNCVLPYTSDESALYDQAVAGIAGVATWSNAQSADTSTIFTFGILQTPAESPTVGGKNAIDLTLNMIARKSGGTEALVVTNDSAT